MSNNTTIADAIGGTVAKVAQAARLIRPVADKCMYSPECAIVLQTLGERPDAAK